LEQARHRPVSASHLAIYCKEAQLPESDDEHTGKKIAISSGNGLCPQKVQEASPGIKGIISRRLSRGYSLGKVSKLGQ
jgi:hypothetical protein